MYEPVRTLSSSGKILSVVPKCRTTTFGERRNGLPEDLLILSNITYLVVLGNLLSPGFG